MLIKVPNRDTAVVVAALSRQIRKLPATLRRWLTWERGVEMAQHKAFTVATGVKAYFCGPQSPWQRGTNEDTNLLLGQRAGAEMAAPPLGKYLGDARSNGSARLADWRAPGC